MQRVMKLKRFRGAAKSLLTGVVSVLVSTPFGIGQLVSPNDHRRGLRAGVQVGSLNRDLELTSTRTDQNSDFEARCHSEGVIKCVGFDEAGELVGTDGSDPFGLDTTYVENPANLPVIDTAIKASGPGSLKFTIPGRGHASSSGAYFTNFSNNLSVQFGPGEEFYIQWRQRFSPEYITNKYESEGWKQIIVGQGDRPGKQPGWACSPMEIVVVNYNMRGHPEAYHSCGDKGGQYEDFFKQDRRGRIVVQNGVDCTYPDFSRCVKYKPNQWMTFQMHVKVSSAWYINDGNYRHDGVFQLWVAEEGKPSMLVIDLHPAGDAACDAQRVSIPACMTGYDYVNVGGMNRDPAAKYGKLYLLPYQTKRELNQPSVSIAYTWYDDLIISRRRIPDPH
ncbi:MAG TPA: hypothetical protein VNB49_16645 [Candidatus Dormibacteraeota bacterium]|nr:hypothetical protein [Candidatus Dormibacteraeota bacterium]